MIAFCLFLIFSWLGMHGCGEFLALPALGCLIYSLVQFRNSLRPQSGPGIGHTGSSDGSRYPYDTTRYAYDDKGKCYDIEDGSFTQGLDGRYRGPVTKDGYVTIERDHHGDLHVL